MHDQVVPDDARWRDELRPSRVLVDRIVHFGDVSYRYVLAEDGWSGLSEALADLQADRLFVVADSELPAQLVRRIVDAATAAAPVELLRLPATEPRKRLAIVEELAARIVRAGGTRRSCVIGVGGGLVGNVAGLLAALLYRGIRLVQLPTTLLAMSDSTLSVKQAVNTGEAKNTLGCFYSPVLVWADLAVLRELPDTHLRTALCEAAKNVLAIVPQKLTEFLDLIGPGGTLSTQQYRWLIELCLSAKTQVLRTDPHERQAGIVLEYGHTVGHSIELVSGGQVPHGYAIGLGMLAAAEVSVLLGELARCDADRHWDVLSAIGAPLRVPAEVGRNEVLARLAWDNKRGYLPTTSAEVAMVLLGGLGRPLCTDGLPLRQVPWQIVQQGLEVIYR